MSTAPAPRKDPMKSFRGIMAGTLILEAIVVALALPVVANLGGGVGTGTGYLVLALIVALLGTCALLRFPWSVWVVVALHVAMIAGWFAMTALGVIGVVFSLVWTYLLWLRRDVAKRMAEGRLPSQQQ
ncbi:DUF4233 domain-containing protein [Saccharothrix coeruleofusca]|uniref:DUF4233 domain-containing protein n=1 Tax=Saccharothrix coeruleofusca TaxID=33919 RepID=A0A918EDB3_9PSEU|nr:DUF4233 domain-containing protein [Saccharothrix coeruleofusca]MBP2334184.1 general stress protein CsbA [Saccharothrix coeruleofusca]GGP42860.1 hypothetical protein GCM10010185_12980 [Saccharothrix coeruleofusca]